MRAILLMAVAMLGCGGGDGDNDPHDAVDCSSYWTVAKCERACAAQPTAGGTCRAAIGAGGAIEQCAANQIASHDGELGCCTSGTVAGEVGVVFVECEAQ